MKPFDDYTNYIYLLLRGSPESITNRAISLLYWTLTANKGDTYNVITKDNTRHTLVKTEVNKHD